jgi:hypothetical protein
MTRTQRAARRALAAIAGALLATTAHAFESDVHYGLTEWLAIQAGFPPQQAQIVAMGNQREDSGMMDSLEFVLQYACLAQEDHGARITQELHYPSATPIPAPAAQRAVTAGSEAARKAAEAMAKSRPDQAGFMLHKLGEGLHPLQDSWSHQGVPAVPATGYFDCDPTRAFAHPASRGGWDSHRADLTRHWPEDTLAMAQATYDVLTRFPKIDNVERKAQPWSAIQPKLGAFIKAATKAEKKAWFTGQGITDVTFLYGISLPDGGAAFTERWAQHRLPPLTRAQSTQRPTPQDILDFYNALFADWVAAGNFDELAARHGAPAAARAAKRDDANGRRMSRAELAARLKLWRFRDHGRVSELAHAQRALTPAQIAEVNRIGKDPRAFAQFTSLTDAFYPLMPKGNDVQPLFPFLVESVPVAAGSAPRAVAMAKLRHTPYDSVALVAEKLDGRWQLVAVVATVDH